MSEKTLQAACSQLLSPSDLKISPAVIAAVAEHTLEVEIIHDSLVIIKIYSQDPIYLSKMTPIFSYLGFDIIDEVSFVVTVKNQDIHISRFNLDIEDGAKLKSSHEHIIQAMRAALLGKLKVHNELFSLIHLENFSLRHLQLLEAMIEYLDQAVRTFNKRTIEHALKTHHHITKLFIDYFITKFDPHLQQRETALEAHHTAIEEAIKEVPYITDDQILKFSFELLKSMVRTNYFLDKESIAFKIDVSTYKNNLKGIQPNIETFIFHQSLSGLHLRMSHISRGGLRWSERYDDYRQEIKSLMITQEGKNSIIVPNGAKGGFVIKEDLSSLSKERFTELYSLFIDNLLDLVDNRVEGKIVRDPAILAYDDEDSYFVVAADKGTASMSDVANSIALQRGYWLGDAFASGGSKGYSHKDLGITAKGALKSTERFFIEKGINFYEKTISMVGIGSMNGDVFGNGVLLSQAFKLIGAISHKEIFIDPNPIPMVAFQERQRLFISKSGNWSNYNNALISKGGGVFLRSSKSIEISPEIQKLLGITVNSLCGEDLGRALLCAKVDMLFNGGVGTYVKSSEESNLDIGDKQNEAIRIDASELRAFAVCEGGNLGFTQKARIEYAKKGGKINIDGIDNAAGVNISDHEVNIKILLSIIESKGFINDEEKYKLLKSLDEKVINLVLWNNYFQALCISKEEITSKVYLDDYLKIITLLEENIEAFKRRDFYIPKDENIREILTPKGSIVRPILASIVSYSKIYIKSQLMQSSFIDEPFALNYLYKYFPKSFTSTYQNEINEHPLRREIISMVIADTIINDQGILFLSDAAKIGKETFIIKIKSYLINNQLFGANDIRHELFRQDYVLNINKQYEMLIEIEKALTFSTKWMLRYLHDYKVDANYLLDFKESIFTLLTQKHLPKVIKFTGDQKIDTFFTLLNHLRFSVAVMTIKEDMHAGFDDVASLFYIVIEKLRIIELLEILDDFDINDTNLRKERRQLRQIIEHVIIRITEKIHKFRRVGEDPFQAYENFLINGGEAIKQTHEEMDNFFQSENKTLNGVSIVVHSLLFSTY